jgi:hypothetical protein
MNRFKLRQTIGAISRAARRNALADARIDKRACADEQADVRLAPTQWHCTTRERGCTHVSGRLRCRYLSGGEFMLEPRSVVDLGKRNSVRLRGYGLAPAAISPAAAGSDPTAVGRCGRPTVRPSAKPDRVLACRLSWPNSSGRSIASSTSCPMPVLRSLVTTWSTSWTRPSFLLRSERHSTPPG